MMQRSEKPTVIDVAVGALLHDIGKLLQRASTQRLTHEQMSRASDILPVYQGRHTHWHALWSDAFFDWSNDEQLPWPKGLDPNWIRDLAVYHHRPLQPHATAPGNVITELVTIADRLASGYEPRPRDIDQESDDGQRDRFRRIPLKAIVPSLSLKGSPKGPSGHHLPREFNAESLVPDRQSDEDQGIGDKTISGYRSSWEGFRTGWRALTNTLSHESSPEVFEEGLLGLCERWLWSIPSSTIDEPDISLFDHSRAVAAFAAALYQHHAARGELNSPSAIRDSRRPKFRILVGDMSGLQSTLFRFNRERIRGLNRILRGRSLRFQLIADAGTRRVLKEFEMPWSSALQTAGGRFQILLPDLGEDEMHERTGRLRNEFDEWIAQEYTGDLGIGLSLSDPFSAHDLVRAKDESDDTARNERANKVRDAIGMTAELAKLRQLQSPAEKAVLNISFPHGTCSACGVRPAAHAETEEHEAYCSSCEAENELGRRFPKSHKVLIERKAGRSAILGLSYGLYGDDGRGMTGWRFGNEGQRSNLPAAFRPAYCYVPRLSQTEVEKFNHLDDHDDIAAGDVKTFEVLAESGGAGRKMLAVLMADVDQLGRLFLEGTGPRWSLARAAALSRMIDGYFSVRLPALLEKEWPNIYTVYAGGDDLLLLGPWKDIFAFATELHEDFTRYSLGNPDVTLSAGIALFDVKAPVSAAARQAKERLAEVKANDRNGISAIESSSLPWACYREALTNAGKLCDFLKDDTLSVATLYRLLNLSDSATRIVSRTAKPSDYAWRARLGYTLARTLPKHTNNERQRAAFDFVIRLFGLDRQLSGSSDQTPGVRLALSHAIYQNR